MENHCKTIHNTCNIERESPMKIKVAKIEPPPTAFEKSLGYCSRTYSKQDLYVCITCKEVHKSLISIKGHCKICHKVATAVNSSNIISSTMRMTQKDWDYLHLPFLTRYFPQEF